MHRQKNGMMMAKMAGNNGRALSTLDYAKKDAPASAMQIRGQRVKENPYGTVEISDMFKREAKAQYDGIVPRYPVPDTGPKMYRIYGQTAWNNSKSKRSTYID